MGSRKKTHEEYVAELAIKNPNVEVIGRYDGAHTKIMHHCLIHDVYWDVLPGNVLAGKGCKECMKEKNRNKFVKSHDEYVSDVARVNPDIVVIGKYINSNTPIMHLCKKHNVEWMAYPNNILKGQGCVECGNEKFHDKRCKKHEDYVDELAVKNPTVKVIGEYVDSQTKILHHCNIHNIDFMQRPSDALKGGGCSICHRERIGAANSMTYEEYIEALNDINPSIVVLGDYINASTPILHKCVIHNVEWMVSPSNILSGHGCRECGNEKIKKALSKTQEQYIEEVANVNPDIEVMGQYINARTPIMHRCKIDGYEWMTMPYSVLSGYGCPVCSESSGERQIRQWLDKHCIVYEYQKIFDDCRNVLPLPFDFYLPKYNSCIEFDGGQHYFPVNLFGGEESFEKTVKHDEIKNKYCEDNDIRLLRIPYYEDVDEQLNNFLFT